MHSWRLSCLGLIRHSQTSEIIEKRGYCKNSFRLLVNKMRFSNKSGITNSNGQILDWSYNYKLSSSNLSKSMEIPRWCKGRLDHVCGQVLQFHFGRRTLYVGQWYVLYYLGPWDERISRWAWVSGNSEGCWRYAKAERVELGISPN